MNKRSGTYRKFRCLYLTHLKVFEILTRVALSILSSTRSREYRTSRRKYFQKTKLFAFFFLFLIIYVELKRNEYTLEKEEKGHAK